MSRDVAETSQLLLLGQQREEGVEHNEDQRERSLDRDVDEVPHRDTYRFSPSPGAQLGDHRLRGVDAVNFDASRREWERDSSSTYPQFESSPALRE